MTLTEAIVAEARQHLDGVNPWYGWREPDAYPDGIALPEGASGYAKSIALKRQLHEQWQRNDPPGHQQRLAEFHVRDWGGLRQTPAAKIAEFARRPAEDLIAAYGEQSIAAWSKVLVLRCPEKYAIYDSRVAASLNALQQLHGTQAPAWFPGSASRNRTIQEKLPLLQAQAQNSNWQYTGQQKFPGFYNRYLALLQEAVQRLQDEGRPTDGIATVEMLLYAKATDLLQRAVP